MSCYKNNNNKNCPITKIIIKRRLRKKNVPETFSCLTFIPNVPQ